MVTKHTKPSAANPQGGIVHKEAPIDISNVMLVVDGKATRVGFEVKDGKKVRVAKADRQGDRLIRERRKKRWLD